MDSTNLRETKATKSNEEKTVKTPADAEAILDNETYLTERNGAYVVDDYNADGVRSAE